ncbi:hypothetical protein J1TS5_04230 [Paenibacillus macerans]|nr:hypothetical protein J1TS5_04230 [Paenibacillus macerans]
MERSTGRNSLGGVNDMPKYMCRTPAGAWIEIGLFFCPWGVTKTAHMCYQKVTPKIKLKPLIYKGFSQFV